MVTPQATDADLLDAYARTGSQDAFAEIVARHIDMIHLTARRMLRDGHLAEDATQAVFLLLARRAGRLRHTRALSGWLYLATTYTVRNMQRSERRQRQREQAVLAGRPGNDGPSDTPGLDLDAALSRLRPKYREVLVLRYLKSQGVPQVAADLGISEAAAGKRLVRAMASLRRVLRTDEAGVTTALAVTGTTPPHLAHTIVATITGGTASAPISGLATTTGKGMTMLKLVSTAKFAAGVLGVTAVGLLVAAALPEGATTRPGQASTLPATAPGVAAGLPPADAAEASADIVAIDEKMSLWWIDPASHCRVEKGELIVHNPTGKEGAFSGLIGGPSWENHHVTLEFLVERNTSPQHGGYAFNIQIAPNNFAMFFQLMGTACNICCFTPEVNGGQFTHISDRQAPPVTLNRWYRLEVISQSGQISMLLDGQLMNQADLPCSTRGTLGLLVNFNSDAVVHLRNMQVGLVDPDPQQLAESKHNAKDNWTAYLDQLKQAGKPLPKAPW